MHSREVKDGRIDNNEAKKVFKTLEDMVVKLTILNWSTGQVIMSILTSSFYLKLINGNIGINVAKLNTNEFKHEIDVLKRKKGKKLSYKANKKYVLENAQALYHELNIIVDAFENRIFESKYRPEIDVDIDLTPDSNTYESYGLTSKELRMFKNLF